MPGNIPSSSKGKTGKNNVTEDVENDVDEIPDSDFSKAATRVFDKIDNGKDGVLQPSNLLTLLKQLGRVFIVRSWRVIC